MGGGGGDSPETTESNASEGGVTVNIRCTKDSKFCIHACLDSTAGSFKTVVARNCVEHQCLIYKGQILKDNQTLAGYGLEADHTVHLVRGFAHSSSANPAVAATAGAPNSFAADGRSVRSDEVRAFGRPGTRPAHFPRLDFNGLGGDPGLFEAGLPEFDQVQQHLTQNPDLMRQMMNSPMFQSVMNNSDIIKNVIMNNPQMREIVDRNPELAHILNDPSTLHQTLQTASNPELMREMMPNTDKAMSNIEASLEGFNMLRRMYENVQEPLLNATTMAGDSINNPASNPFAALLGTQGGEQRHQSTGPTNPASEASTDSPAPNAIPLPNPCAFTGLAEFQKKHMRAVYGLSFSATDHNFPVSFSALSFSVTEIAENQGEALKWTDLVEFKRHYILLGVPEFIVKLYLARQWQTLYSRTTLS